MAAPCAALCCAALRNRKRRLADCCFLYSPFPLLPIKVRLKGPVPFCPDPRGFPVDLVAEHE